MRSILGGLAILVAMCGLAAAQDPVDAAKLIGKWELVEGKKGQSLVLEFLAGSKINVLVVEAGKEVKLEGSYKVYENNKMDVTLKYMSDEIKESLVIKKLTADELITEDSKGKSETMKRKK